MGRIAVTLLATVFLFASVSSQTTPGTLDVILRGGTVFDGTGARGYRADIGVRNGRIATIGNLTAQRADVTIDVTDLYIAPGFINIHSHPIGEGLTRAENML